MRKWDSPKINSGNEKNCFLFIGFGGCEYELLLLKGTKERKKKKKKL